MSDLIERAKLRDDLAERLELVKEIWGPETDALTIGNHDGQVSTLERILSDIDFGLWQPDFAQSERTRIADELEAIAMNTDAHDWVGALLDYADKLRKSD